MTDSTSDGRSPASARRADFRFGLGALVASALFAASLGGARDFSHIDEHRYAEVSRVMAEPGGDWLVPRLNGEIYPAKPPLFFWMVAAAQRLGISLPYAALLPSQLGALAALLAIFGIARRLGGRDAGVASAVLLACCIRFANFAGRANLDALLAGCVTVSIYGFARGNAATDRSVARVWYAVAAIVAGVGVLAKGPLAIAVPGVAVIGSRVLEGRGRSLLSPWLPAALVLALLPVALWLGLAGRRAGWSYVSSIVMHHGVDQVLGRINHAGEPWDYLRMFSEGFLPGTCLLPAAFALLPRRWPMELRDALPVAWLCGGLLLLAAFPVTRPHYLMPLYPGAALLTARVASADFAPLLRARRSARALLALGRVEIALLAFVVGVALVASALLVAFGDEPTRYWHAWRAVATPPPFPIVLGAALGVLTAAGAAVSLGARSMRGRASGLAVAALAATIAQARVLQPILTAGVGRRAFLESVSATIGDAPVADYGGMHFAANWVLQRDVVPVLQGNADAERFLARSAPRPAFLLVDRESLDRQGVPAGTRVLRSWPRGLDDDVVLLGSIGP